jgi:MFS-type transporter involved in bile tolerance (Atg22 family)
VIVLRFTRAFWKETTSRMFYNALLTAVIVFCTALATRVAGTELTKLVVVSAGVSAVAAFCQILLEYIRHEREAEQDSNR